MSDTVKLGWRQDATNDKRDAVHVAIAPVTALEDLSPGQHVGLGDGGISANAEHIGIVDPFLTGRVTKGDRVYLMLYPNTVTSLRHEWTHPSFSLATDKAASEKWLREFCRTADCPDYESVIAAATNQPLENYSPEYYSEAYQNDGEYLHFNGRDAHSEIPPEFWDHVEKVSGTKIPAHRRATSFSCSC